MQADRQSERDIRMDRLKDTLEDLHRRLADTDDVDPELKELLEVLDGDIHKLLETGAPEPAGLASQAESVASRFAARHPQLEGVLREIADALARVGI